MVGSCTVLNRPMPEGTEGPKAEDLTDRIMAFVNTEAWENTAIVEFTFKGLHHFFWDKKRHLAQVSWKNYRVLIDLNNQRGKAWKNEEEVSAEKRDALLKTAWELWCNDTFWLNPLAKLRDDGTSRKYVALEGPQEGLLITYGSGGVTPGDSYLWYVNADGQPTHWRMWVSVLPLGGIQVPFSGWKRLHTGAQVSTLHDAGLLALTMDNVRSADTIEELAGSDIFQPLFNYR